MFLPYLMLACSSMLLTNGQGPDMFGIINILYLKADPDMDGDITQKNLTSVYLALDVNETGFVTKDEYVAGWIGITLQSKEMAMAYFELSDVDRNGIIDERDTKEIFRRFDVDSNGHLSDDEFVTHFEMIYHAVPFVVLYERLLARENIKGKISRGQFQTLFYGLSGEVDGSMTKANLETAWVAEHFGTPEDADSVVTSLDKDRNGVISKDDLGARFDVLDMKGSGMIGLNEIKAILLVTKAELDDKVIG